MSNSPLVSYTKISPNKTSPRTHKIDTITIHCVVGQLTVESLGNVFAPASRKASSNYGVGKDGRIGMYVEEKDQSWCSSSRANDDRAITIEVASDMEHPYAINDAAYKGLIELLVDICKRNDIKELKWKGDKSLVGNVEEQNMTVHRWFSNTICPGDYLYGLHGKIASEVNSKLKGENSKPSEPIVTEPSPTPASKVIKPGYVVKIDEDGVYYDGSKIPDWVKRKQWVVKDVDANRIVIDKSSDGKNSICSPIHAKYLTIVSDSKVDKPAEPDDFKVRISIPNLNIRKGPGTNYSTRGRYTGVGVFTIVDVKQGEGSKLGWGLLKTYGNSRDGWISLDYAKRV